MDKLATAVEAAEVATANAEARLREAEATHEGERQQLLEDAAAEDARARVGNVYLCKAADACSGSSGAHICIEGALPGSSPQIQTVLGELESSLVVV